MLLAQPGPGRYVHGETVLDDLATYLSGLGTRALVITGVKSYEAAGVRLERALRQGAIQWQVVRYRGQCSDEEAERVLRLAGSEWDMVIGVGGGKVLDLGKVVSQTLNRPYITVPTIPSNCATTTPVAVIYFPNGLYKISRVYDAPPALAVVDDRLLAQSPSRYFVSGLGDTLAKPYEALASRTKSMRALGQAGVRLAELSATIIREAGVEALRQIKAHQIASEASDLIDVILLMGGMVGGVGGDSCRAAAAHAIHNGLTILPSLHETSHGDKVAYGLLIQGVLLNNAPEEIQAMQRFLQAVDLPWSWATLSGESALPPYDVQRAVAEKSLSPDDTMHRMPRPVTVDDVMRAFEVVEELAGSLA